MKINSWKTREDHTLYVCTVKGTEKGGKRNDYN